MTFRRSLWSGLALLAALVGVVSNHSIRAGVDPQSKARKVARYPAADLQAAQKEASIQEQVRETAQALEAWLAADGQNGQNWRQYLELDSLASELASLADNDAPLQRVLERLSSGAAGLESYRFAALRHALEQWLASRPVVRLADLPAAARLAKDHFHQASGGDLLAGKQALREWVQVLDRRLATAGKHGPSWREYLLFQELRAQADASAAPDIERLDLVRNRFRAGRILWPDRVLKGASEAIDIYARLARVFSDPDAEAAYGGQLDELASHLEAFLKAGDEGDLDAVAAVVGWLDDHGQAPQLVHDIRSHLARPNLLLQVTAAVLDAQVNRKIDESYPVNENIAGTRVVGRGALHGDLSMALLPDESQAAFDLRVDGITSAFTSGQHSKVRIKSRDSTSVMGHKRLTLDAEGFHAEPADVRATSRITYTNVAAQWRMFDGVAARRAEESKPQAQRDSANRTRSSIQRRLDKEAEATLDRLNQSFLADFRRPLVEGGGSPEGMWFSTREGRLVMNSLQATAGQLGPAKAPPVERHPCDIWIRVHDSWIDRVSMGHLSGRTVAGHEFRSTLAESVGLPKPASPGVETNEQWTITFADLKPITVDIGDGRATIVLRGKEFTSDGKPFPEMNITTPYRLEMMSQGLKLIREEPPKLYPPDFVPGSGQRLTGRQLAMRSAMARVFEQVFETEYLLSEIRPESKRGQLDTLRIVHCDAQQGWLNIALRQTTK